MPDYTTDTQAAFDAGILLADPAELDASEKRFLSQVLPAGASVHVHDLEALRQAYAEHPHRKVGIVHVQDAESFILYVSKHQLEATEIYADGARKGLVGIINAHAESDDTTDEGPAGHGDHRCALELVHSEEWTTWTGNDKKYMNQIEFAQFLEDNAVDVVDSPGADPATMLEVAEHFYATPNVDFKSSVRLDSGAVQLRYEETHAARAGQSGDLEIPKQFVLGISPFVGGDPVEITARFRYRIREGHLTMSYALLNAAQIERQAFLDIVQVVRDSVVPPVFLGRPA
jgi:uncharacterized protein YfdQ (DUF2303 family)